MTREHSPRPGAHWDTRVVPVEQVVPDTDDPSGNEPAEPRNRRQRRDTARANRQKGHR